MTLALDAPRGSLNPFKQLVRLTSHVIPHFARARRAHWQAAIFRGMDTGVLRDIGFSADYIRADWLDFAAEHPSLVAPSTPAGMADCVKNSERLRT